MSSTINSINQSIKIILSTTEIGNVIPWVLMILVLAAVSCEDMHINNYFDIKNKAITQFSDPAYVFPHISPTQSHSQLEF